jgi:hypothetical protein
MKYPGEFGQVCHKSFLMFFKTKNDYQSSVSIRILSNLWGLQLIINSEHQGIKSGIHNEQSIDQRMAIRQTQTSEYTTSGIRCVGGVSTPCQ